MRVLALCLALTTSPAWAGGIHSYIDENGVKIFTNEPSRREDPVPAETVSAKLLRSHLYGPLIQETASRYGIDEKLVEAIMAVESDFNPFAVSSKNCKGLMQLHPDTARRFGVLDIFNPAENIEGGVRYLQFLMETFDNDLTQVVAAYNAGENAVKKHAGIPPFAETREYVKKVGSLYDLTAKAEDAANAPPPVRKVVRLTLPDGGVLYTNAPADAR